MSSSGDPYRPSTLVAGGVSGPGAPRVGDRQDVVHGDLICAPLARGGPSQGAHRLLRHVVGAIGRQPGDSGQRGEVDDATLVTCGRIATGTNPVVSGQHLGAEIGAEHQLTAKREKLADKRVECGAP